MGAWDSKLCLYTADWSYEGDAWVAGRSVTNRVSLSLSFSSSSDSANDDPPPPLTSSPECAASTSIHGLMRAAAASRTLNFGRGRFFAGGGGRGGGDEGK
jgi:hypothetical protein